MKQKTKKQWLVLLLVLCTVMLFSTFMMNTGFSATYVLADSVTSAEDNLTFSMNSDNSGYKVVARNKQITEAMIPAKYNGLPVTEISDNGFMSCTKLTKVWIPYTVTKIGNNAFANCSVLEEVNGMSCVTTIGNNAFAMCRALDNLILPHSITKLGNTILRNNPNTVYSRLSEADMKALNANWIMANESTIVVYGNELVLDEVYDGENMIGYAINRSQNLNSEVDFVLGDTYNGLPLLEIETWAFAYSSFNTFTLRHGEIVPEVEESAPTSYSVVNDDCNHIVNISSGAFIGMDVTDVNLLVDVTFYDSTVYGYDEYENGYSTDIFASSTVRRIILPNNITVLPRSTFSGCENLREISNTDANIDVNHLSSDITSIGSDAFIGCKSLINLYIPSSIVNMGNSVFAQWGDSSVTQTIHLDFYEAPVGYENYNWNINWLGTTYDNVKTAFKTINILLDKEGGDNGTDSLEAMYHQDMPEAVAPSRAYYNFGGYYSGRNGQGTQYYDENMHSVVVWDKQTDSILYAYWIPYTYTVTFDKQGGNGGSDSANALYEQSMPEAAAPEKIGYKFSGYWGTFNGITKKYYDQDMNSVIPWDIPQDTTLYADWEKRNYNVFLEPQGGTSGVSYVTTTYDEAMPSAPKPSRTGWTFNGYYTAENGQGTKYYNSDMTSSHNWNIDENNVTLYAYWVQTPYTITFDAQGGTSNLPSVNPVYYLGALPTATIPNRVGYMFKGYFEAPNGEGKKYYNADITTAYFYDVDYDLTVYAYWEAITYNITYLIDELKGVPENFTNPNPTSYTVEDWPIEIVPVEINGYCITWSLSRIEENTIGNIQINGTVTAIVYNITYNLNGGISNGGNPDTYTVESSVVLKDATHDTLYFNGWTYKGKNIKNLNGITGDITIEANWTDVKTIYIKNAFESLEITDPKVCIILNVQFSSNCTINISSNTSLVSIVGPFLISTYNMNINIKKRTTDFSLGLKNIVIKAHSNRNAIMMDSTATLNLFTYSSVSILGCTESSEFVIVGMVPVLNGIAAINCGQLVIQSADDLYIKGGNGVVGTDNPTGTATNGGSAAPGVIVKSDVYIVCSNVTITGGWAAKGGDGLYRGYGGSGAYPVVGSAMSKVYVLKGTTNVHLYRTLDAADGTGLDHGSGGGTSPIDPIDPINPPIGPGIEVPPIDCDLDPGAGGGIIIPEPPFIPTLPIA